MTPEQHAKKIKQRFLSETYKQFAYQTRPFTTIAMAVLLIGLGFFHIVNLAVISWILAAFVLDNVALTPIMNALRAMSNLANGRKTFKAKIMLIVIVVSLLTGAVLGYYVWAPMAMVTKFALDYIALTGCSPFLISMGAMAGGYFSHATHRIPLFWGIFIGSCIASVSYLPIPIALEVVYFSAVATAFFATIIAKQSLRLYYKMKYGHSNADGYEFARESIEQRQFIQNQAAILNVSPQVLVEFATDCRLKIDKVYHDASFISEYMSYRSHITNSYKDIYFGLMKPDLSETDAKTIKELIQNSTISPDWNRPEHRAEHQKKVARELRLGAFFNPNIETRMMVHQFKIADGGGLNAELANAFRL